MRNLDMTNVKNIYNQYIGKALAEIALSYYEDVDDMKLVTAINTEDDQVMIAHIYNRMKFYFLNDQLDNLMDLIIEEVGTKEGMANYKNVMISLVEIYTNK